MMNNSIYHHSSRGHHFGIPVKDLLNDKWKDIPEHQKEGLNTCPDCGLPTMRLVYQEGEVYTAVCMSCGHAHRFHANSLKGAVEKFNAVDERAYALMLHTAGLDNSKRVYRNYYDADEAAAELLSKYPDFIRHGKDHFFHLTREGMLFRGWDMSDDSWKQRLFKRAHRIVW